MKIILASSSPRRKELLSKIVKDFEIIPSNFDENSIKCGEQNPSKLVEILSKAKGEEVFSRMDLNDNFIIISSDTMVFLEGKLLNLIFLDVFLLQTLLLSTFLLYLLPHLL